MNEELVHLKAKCFDIQNNYQDLITYVAAIAKALEVDTINEIYPTLVSKLEQLHKLEEMTNGPKQA